MKPILLFLSLPFWGMTQLYCPCDDDFKGEVAELKVDYYKLPRSSGVIWSPQEHYMDSLPLFSSSRVLIDPMGRIVEKWVFGSDQNQRVRCQQIFSTEGLILVKSTLDRHDSLDVRIEYEYTSGELATTRRYNRKGEVWSTHKFWIDSTRRTRGSMEVFEHMIEDRWEYDLDRSFRKIHLYSVDDDENRVLYMSWQYDSLGRVKKSMNWKTGESRTNFTYDSLDRVVTVDWFDREGKKIATDSSAWDAYSNLIYRMEYIPHRRVSEIQAYEYEYDVHGNWIEKRVYSGVGPYSRLLERFLRSIQYR